MELKINKKDLNQFSDKIRMCIDNFITNNDEAFYKIKKNKIVIYFIIRSKRHVLSFCFDLI